jgi:predicted aspartyl protease
LFKKETRADLPHIIDSLGLEGTLLTSKEVETFRIPGGGGFAVSAYFIYGKQEIKLPLSFLVDTGASITTISYRDAAVMGLDYGSLKKRKEILGIGGRLQAYSIEDVTILFATKEGALHVVELPEVMVLPRSTENLYLPSILGRDALKNFSIEFDPERLRLFLESHIPARVQVSKTKRAFLSHNSKDKVFVRRLASDLDRNGVDVWFDEWRIKPGESISGSIAEGLKKYNNFVLIMTPNCMTSKWVARELSVAIYRFNSKQKKGQKGTKIVPALAKECSIPLWLSDIKYVDFRRCYRKAFKELLDALV